MPTSPEPASEPTPTGPASTDPASSGSVADAFATFFQAMGRVETELATTQSEQAELIGRFAELTDRFAELTGSVIGLANRVNEIEQNAKDRAEESAKGNSPAPVDAALSPDSMQRIAQIASELGTASQAATQAAAQAASTTLTETANESIAKIAGALADLIRLETNRVLLDNQSVGTSASHSDTGHSDTGHMAAATPAADTPAAGTPGTGHMAAATPAAESPASPARAFAPPAKTGEELEPLTLDSLDDPFLEALIKSEPLAN